MKRKLLLVIILGVLLILLFSFTSPVQTSLPIFLMVFSLLFFFFASLFLIIISLAYDNLRQSQIIFIALVLAFCPVTFLALESLSTISILDILLTIGIPVIIIWYGLKRSN